MVKDAQGDAHGVTRWPHGVSGQQQEMLPFRDSTRHRRASYK